MRTIIVGHWVEITSVHEFRHPVIMRTCSLLSITSHITSTIIPLKNKVNMKCKFVTTSRDKFWDSGIYELAVAIFF